MSNIKLMNFNTGKIIETDIYKLMKNGGIPEGYRSVEDLTTDEWVVLYRELMAKCNEVENKLISKAVRFENTLGVIVDEVIDIIISNSSLMFIDNDMLEDSIINIGNGSLTVDENLWRNSILPNLERRYNRSLQELAHIYLKDLKLKELIIDTATYIKRIIYIKE